MLRVRQHSHEDVCVFGKRFNFRSESYIVTLGLGLLASVDIESKDLVTFLSQVYCHRKTHVSETDEADLSEREE